MKIKYIDTIIKNSEGKYTISLLIGKGTSAKRVEITLSDAEFEEIEKGHEEPTPLTAGFFDGADGLWVYKNKLLQTDISVVNN